MFLSRVSRTISRMGPSSHGVRALTSSATHDASPLPASEVALRVRQIVEKYVACKDGEWQEVQLASPSLKFKIVSEAMTQCGQPLSNVDLTNTLDVKSLVTALSQKRKSSESIFSNTDSVAEYFENGDAQLPANVYLMESIQGEPRPPYTPPPKKFHPHKR
ncbi:uncharacterized protein BJ171DRAFT_600314 [Polychytrium aggregatum]|uniref:uncharacterized protein n=1 Tax=Polychytrium aggregatum TaxID=110093 RepID=UPI0022FE25F4|nr:uncharacterized protein BJ171DRAFT_600314 [Polychytrium aggregatum]KAI9203165.1 hypothetical protein BJ171DRAFT_600314 [Polychytrium aggregatum]